MDPIILAAIISGLFFIFVEFIRELRFRLKKGEDKDLITELITNSKGKTVQLRYRTTQSMIFCRLIILLIISVTVGVIVLLITNYILGRSFVRGHDLYSNPIMN